METMDAADDLRAKRNGARLAMLGHVYRYMPLRADRLESILLGSRLWAGPFGRLNDPFEAAVPWRWDAPEPLVRAHWAKYMEEHPEEVPPGATLDRIVEVAMRPETHASHRRTIHETILEMGVVCFSERPDDIPMWSYYADAHAGVVLMFRGMGLMGLPECFPPVPVTYATDFEPVPFYESTQHRLVEALVARKAAAWRHEREWRVVRKPVSGEVEFLPDALDGIILGCRISDADRAEVERIVGQRQHPARVLRARVGDGYKLTISA